MHEAHLSVPLGREPCRGRSLKEFERATARSVVQTVACEADCLESCCGGRTGLAFLPTFLVVDSLVPSSTTLLQRSEQGPLLYKAQTRPSAAPAESPP